MNAFKPRETLTEQVARHIENLIAFEQLRSGERIYESAMAKQMDVSHGSIREGLLLLEKRLKDLLYNKLLFLEIL